MSEVVRRVPPLRDLIPRGPALSAAARARLLRGAGPSGVALPPGASGPPVAPLQVFGATYDLDLVLVTDHPDWDMHELARLDTPDGPVWMCKDSRAGTLEQTIVADVSGLATLFPEIPLRREQSDVRVVDRSTASHLDLDLAYTNVDGERVEVRFAGPRPRGPQRARNGSTMGHSRDHVLAALDISHQSFARRARVRIGGTQRRIRRVLGLVPLQVSLVQTQAGFAAGSWSWTTGGAVLCSTHASGAVQAWSVDDHGPGVTVVQHHPWRTITHRYIRVGDRLELAAMAVCAAGATLPACRVRFAPYLPDLRAAPRAAFTGTWVLDVHGQPGHAWGHVHIVPQGVDTARVRVRAAAPRWCLDRPIDHLVTWRPGAVDVVARVVRDLD